MRPLGVYVHVPFCAAICHYCNFNRGLLEEVLKQRYVSALETHIARDADGSAVDTLYFGGGTPSLLEPAEIARLIQACRDAFAVEAGAEVTIEANPDSVDAARLEGYRAAGVTRVSFGVQSFRAAELRALGRTHSVDRAHQAVRDARAAGFDNVSLDLMMWLPEQRLEHWLESVEALIAVEPEHASLYLLEVYPNAPLRDTMMREAWQQGSDDVAADMYEAAFERLEQHGYQQYEISNVSRGGRTSRHNLKYWQDGEWLAFGCGAHASRAGRRTRLVSNTAEYVAKVHAGVSVEAESRRLSRDERVEEAMFMGLRLVEGVDVAAIDARYGVDVWARFGEALFPYIGSGHVRYHEARLKLTRAGMLVANEILSVFV